MDKIQQAFRDYLQLEKNYSPHTVNGYCQDVEFFGAFLKVEFGDENLLDVNYSQIRSWIVSLVDAGISNASVNRKIASLKCFYKFLLKSKQVETSPLLKHKALKTPKKIQIPFSEKELDMVLNQIKYPDGFEGIRDKLIIDLFYTTGIRRTELIHLKVSNVNASNATLKVLGKRNKERILPILPIVSQQMQTYLSERSNLKQVTDSDFFFFSETLLK